jgi:thioredoxin-like negative regulator of GroEL
METGTVKKTITKGDYEKYLQKGINYSVYKHNMAEDLATNTDLKTKEYINLNQVRMARVEKTYTPSPEMVEQVTNLKHKTNWLVLTEHWCGDASQALPVFNKLAELSDGKINLKLVYRDQEPELMDAYLTNGTRSIPKLIQLDTHNNVTGFWGPRPTFAQQMVKRLKADPTTADTYATELHLWYARDKQQSLEAEILQLFYRANLYCPDCLQ